MAQVSRINGDQSVDTQHMNWNDAYRPCISTFSSPISLFTTRLHHFFLQLWTLQWYHSHVRGHNRDLFTINVRHNSQGRSTVLCSVHVGLHQYIAHEAQFRQIGKNCCWQFAKFMFWSCLICLTNNFELSSQKLTRGQFDFWVLWDSTFRQSNMKYSVIRVSCTSVSEAGDSANHRV